MKTTVLKVTNCIDCIFCGMGGWEGEVNECVAVSKQIQEKDAKSFMIPEKPPKWCPLKAGKITVELTIK